MSGKMVLAIVSICLSLSVMLNYSEQIIEVDKVQMEKAKVIVQQYNEHTEYLDSLLEETTP